MVLTEHAQECAQAPWMEALWKWLHMFLTAAGFVFLKKKSFFMEYQVSPVNKLQEWGVVEEHEYIHLNRLREHWLNCWCVELEPWVEKRKII